MRQLVVVLAVMGFAPGIAPGAEATDATYWRPDCGTAEAQSPLPVPEALRAALAPTSDPAGRCAALAALVSTADGGDADAALLAADILAEGIVVKRDLDRARKIYLAAFDAGSALAGLRLGDLERASAGTSELAAAVAYYEDARLMGEPLASIRLGDYFASIGDAERAIANYQSAADAGIPAAYLSLGSAFSDGQLVPQDLNRALAMFREAMNLGDGFAAAAVASALVASGDAAGALAVLETASAGGNSEATVALGDFYRDGAGYPRDLAKAADAYRAAGAAGSQAALLRLADLERDTATGDTGLRAAATQYEAALASGLAEAGLRLGELYRTHPAIAPKDGIADAYQRSFALGSNDAALRLGTFILAEGADDRHARAAPYFVFEPDAVPAEDAIAVADAIRDSELSAGYSEAMVAIYQHALDAGQTAAAVRLGELYFEGKVLPRDIGKAEHYYLLGGANLPAETLLALGDARRDATGVSLDRDKAAGYYQQALDAGSAEAGLRLGKLLTSGPQVSPEAFERALVALAHAADLGSTEGLMLAGDTVRQAGDADRAIPYFERALDAGVSEAATRLGDIYFSGEAGQPDLPLAASFYDRSPGGPPSAALLPIANALLPDQPRRAVALYQRALALGQSDAARPLGDLQLSGELGKVDPKQAEDYYALAPEGVPSTALIALGDAYRDGAGVPADVRRAVDYYAKADANGLLEAAGRLGDLYFDGQFLPVDLAKAAAYYEKGSAVPAKALLAIGDLYRDGALGTPDGERAAQYYEMAQAANLTGALQRLGDLYLTGAVVAKDIGRATEFYERSKEGIPATALMAVADHFRDLGDKADVERAIGYYKRSMASGNLNAASRLGDIFASASGVAMDVAEAERYYRLAPTGIPPSANIAFGDAYRDGDTVAPDGERAKAYYIAALESDRQLAARRLADLLYSGTLVPRDLEAAAGYYDQAADVSPEILQSLGETFLAGEGVVADLPRGIDYMERAAAAGDRTALRRLGDVFSNGEYAAVDLARSEQYYLRSAEAGDPDALLQLAAGYLDGRFSGNSPERGVALLQRAVERGISAATPMLASALIDGRGVERDVAAAVVVLQGAIETGDIDAARRLLRLYQEGAEDFPRQPRAAQQLLDQIAPRLPRDEAMVEQVLVSIGPSGLPSSTDRMATSFGELEPEDKANLLVRVRQLNENAYVFLLQHEMRSRGLLDEPASGQLTKGTIRQMRALCEQLGEGDVCAAGPMSDQSTRVITDALR